MDRTVGGFQELQVPVLSFFGDVDWMDKSEAKKLGKVSVVAHAGHHMYLEQPQPLVDAIVSRDGENRRLSTGNFWKFQKTF